MTVIVAVDPGGLTGVALYSTEHPRSFNSYEVQGFDGLSRWFFGNITPDVLVVERFLIRANTHKLDAGAFEETTDQIGLCRYVATTAGAEFVRQTPAEAKGFADNDKLHRLGWYNGTRGGHANDAARHLLTYLAKKGDAEVLGRLAG